MDTSAKDFLRDLISKISPSGFEDDAVRLWEQRMRLYTKDTHIDVNGNGIARLGKGTGPKIMLAAHIDEIGYMVKYISKEGYLYFAPIGGIDYHIIPGQRVWLKTGKGIVLGVIGRKPVHLVESQERDKVSKIEQMFIDIGVDSEKKAKKIVAIGDCAVPAVGLEFINDATIIGRGFDDKIGVFVMCETIREISKKKLHCEVCGVATVQEEIGLRGVRPAAYDLAPDVAIVLEVAFATDVPEIDKRKVGDIKIGGGPVICRGPNVNPKLFKAAVETAEKEKIPYQIEGVERATGTDANVIQLTRSGVPSMLITVPNRYMHTPIELVNVRDVAQTVRLTTAVIERISARGF